MNTPPDTDDRRDRERLVGHRREAAADADLRESPRPASARRAQHPLTELHRRHGNRRVAAILREQRDTRQRAAAQRGEKDGEAAQTAKAGVKGATSPLPFGEEIQRSFGSYDVSNVRTAQGGAAGEAGSKLGARAYAFAGKIAFAAPPDLHTTAHEAAHIVQQRSGAKLGGGISQPGDPFEKHADRVANAVVRGKSAEAILREKAGTGASTAPSSATPPIQRQPSPAPQPQVTRPGPKLEARDLTPQALVQSYGGRKGIKPASVKLRLDGRPERQLSLIAATQKLIELGVNAVKNDQGLAREIRGLDPKDQEKRKIAKFLTAIRGPLGQLNHQGEHPGCHYSSRLIIAIATKLEIVCELRETNGDEYRHSFPFFPQSGVGLKHGDDLYGKDVASLTDAKDLLLTKPQIDRYHKENRKLDADRKELSLQDADKPENQPDENAYQRAIAGLRGSVTAFSKYDESGALLPEARRIELQMSRIVSDPEFKRALLVDRSGRLLKTLDLVKQRIRSEARSVSNASLGYIKTGGPIPKTEAEIIKAIAEKLNKGLVSPKSPPGPDVEHMQLLQRTYPAMRGNR